MTTTKVDLRRELDSYAARVGAFRELELPARRYLMIDGHGDPNTSPDFDAALRALYPLAYAVKFASRAELGRDYVVPPLEGLWWADDMDSFTTARDKSRWDWTLLLLIPDWVGPELVAASVESVRRKANAPERLDEVRDEVLEEGRCVQTLHVGPFDDEAALLDRMHHEVIPGLGLALTGTHHEIYLSDRRRVAPDRMRTILRQPVRAAGR
jgi:hypothetical protein